MAQQLSNQRIAWFNGEFMPEREVRIPIRRATRDEVIDDVVEEGEVLHMDGSRIARYA